VSFAPECSVFSNTSAKVVEVELAPPAVYETPPRPASPPLFSSTPVESILALLDETAEMDISLLPLSGSKLPTDSLLRQHLVEDDLVFCPSPMKKRHIKFRTSTKLTAPSAPPVAPLSTTLSPSSSGSLVTLDGDEGFMQGLARTCSVRSVSRVVKRCKKSRSERMASKVLHLLQAYFTAKTSYSYQASKPSHVWSSKKRHKEFMRLVGPLCSAVVPVLARDATLVSLDSPVYVLGDLHGNYKDLMLFADRYWGMGMEMCAAPLLFLGDYVDRGPHSVELTAYLFSLKILYPSSVFLLRGNHELPSLNQWKEFSPSLLGTLVSNMREIDSDTPDVSAAYLWALFNQAFEWLPLAAVINNQVFCCHGGLPRAIEDMPAPRSPCRGKENGLSRRSPARSYTPSPRRERTASPTHASSDLLSHIHAISRPLTEEEINSNETCVSLDLLWADPAPPDKEEAIAESGKMFAPNGRGESTRVFTSGAINHFTRLTACTHLVRAHQLTQYGVDYSKNAHIVTVFSSSHYCGGFNSAAIVLVDRDSLHVATTNLPKLAHPPAAASAESSDS